LGRLPKYVPLATLFEATEVWLSNIKVACEIVGDLVGPCRRLSFQFPGITSKDWAICCDLLDPHRKLYGLPKDIF